MARLNSKIKMLILLSVLSIPLFQIQIANAGITANPNPYALSNTTIDVGQISVANTLISGGTTVYSGQWILSSPNSISQTSIQMLPSTTNLQGDVIVIHVNGGYNVYNAVTGTDQARGAVLLNAMNGIISGDSVYLSASTFDLGNGWLNLGGSSGTLTGVKLYGSGAKKTTIKSSVGKTLPISLIVQPATNSVVADISFVYASNKDTQYEAAWGANSTSPVVLNATIRNVKIMGYTDGIDLTGLNSFTGQVYNATISTLWDAIAVNFGNLNIFDSNVIADASSQNSLLNFGHYTDGITSTGQASTNIVNTIAVGRGESRYNNGCYEIASNSLYIYGGTCGSSGTNSIDVKNTGSSVIYVNSTTSYTTNSGTITNLGLVKFGPYQYQNSPLTPTLPNTATLALTLNAVSSNTLSIKFNGAQYINQLARNTIYGTYTLSALANDLMGNTLILANTLTINPAPRVIWPSSISLDNGQFISTTLSGGSGSFSINLVAPNGAVASTPPLLLGNKITFNNQLAIGIYSYNVVITDTGTTTPYTTNTPEASITVVNALSIPSTPQLSATTTQQNNGITVSTYLTNGVLPYTYNFIIVDPNSGNIVASSGPTSNTYLYSTPNIGSYYANVIVTDASFTPFSKNSIYSAIFNVLPTSGGTTSTTSTIAISSFPGGNPGGSPGGNPGSGATPPPKIISGSCYIFNNLTWYNPANATLNGTTFNLRVNFITPTSAGVTINNNSITLQSQQVQNIFSTALNNFTIALTNITYIPIQDTITLKLCSTLSPYAPGNPNPARPGLVESVNNVTLLVLPPGMINQNLITAPNFGFWNGTITIKNATLRPLPIRLYITNFTNIAPKPSNKYTELVAINISLIGQQNATLYAALTYNCSLTNLNVTPFILKNGAWKIITPYTLVTTNQCTISFPIPRDPTIALFVQNRSSKITSSTTIPVTRAGSTPNPYIAIIAAIVVIIACLAYITIHAIHQRRKGKDGGEIANTEEDDNLPMVMENSSSEEKE